ncbi:hypothetical protein TeGR_g9452 [Tetraparma gracilis]|uniref:Uncharacterized protein n=1 Tax=Tetraparma gracilis TaxID=2962635 RepID=A0ABQ6MJU1_9STRA|nr:hypothetical protein TeGR_g9452 [Tetraparma gracilis]
MAGPAPPNPSRTPPAAPLGLPGQLPSLQDSRKGRTRKPKLQDADAFFAPPSSSSPAPPPEADAPKPPAVTRAAEDKPLLRRLFDSDPTAFDPSPPSLRSPLPNSQDPYSPVTLLLGSLAPPFLGLPFPILQLGHFTLLLTIALASFVHYPGFPLTSLPPALTGPLSAALGATVGMNALLALYVALVEAPAREGQGKYAALWAVKTAGVGGLALYQIRGLPKEGGRRGGRGGKGRR